MTAQRQISQLQAEVASLMEQLEQAKQVSAGFQQKIGQLESSQLLQQQFSPTALNSSNTSNELFHGSDRSTLVLKHMGRMVHDIGGNERFAGSTTGVHFILSIQQALQAQNISRNAFPECCYQLHLLTPSDLNVEHAGDGMTVFLEEPKEPLDVSKVLDEFNAKPLTFYARQIGIYCESWVAFCPVIAGSDLIRNVDETLGIIRTGIHPRPLKCIIICFQIFIMQLINGVSNSSAAQLTENQIENCAAAIRVLLPHVSSMASIPTVQGLVLFSFYIQITGRSDMMASINALLVRNAQKIGLHRHTRRFNFSAGQVEMRTRLWWSVYLFDKSVSLFYIH